MQKRFSLAVLVVLLAVSASAQITTVILVRHGEKAGKTGDVPLAPAGVARAEELARVLADVEVAAVFSTPYLRTEQTAAPLAKAKRLETIIVDANDTYARDLAARIESDFKGKTVVVVGHSDTTVDVLRQLGIRNPRPIADSEYDNFFVVTLVPDVPAKLLTLRYGLASPKESGRMTAALRITGTAAEGRVSSSPARTRTRVESAPARCTPCR